MRKNTPLVIRKEMIFQGSRNNFTDHVRNGNADGWLTRQHSAISLHATHTANFYAMYANLH